MGNAVSGLDRQHPRLFRGVLAGFVLIVFVWLVTPSDLPATVYNRYTSSTNPSTWRDKNSTVSATYPPSPPKYKPNKQDNRVQIVGDGSIYPQIDLKAAIGRSEEIWKRNVAKRTAFITEQGGLEKIRMFSDKGWYGYGQSFTFWSVILLT